MIFLKYKVINLSTSTNRRYKLNKKENKKDRAKIAKARTETMKRTYPENINHSIKRSELFGENGKSPAIDENIERYEHEIIFENKDLNYGKPASYLEFRHEGEYRRGFIEQ